MPNFTLTPIFVNIFDANLSLGLSFLSSSSSFLKTDIPRPYCKENITKNSSIALLLSLTGQFIGLKEL